MISVLLLPGLALVVVLAASLWAVDSVALVADHMQINREREIYMCLASIAVFLL